MLMYTSYMQVCTCVQRCNKVPWLKSKSATNVFLPKNSCCVSHRKRTLVQMNACHVRTATVSLEAVYCVCTFRSVCASKIGALALRSMALSVSKRGGQNLRGGRQRHGMSLWREPWCMMSEL